jgi:hypothetical protein
MRTKWGSRVLAVALMLLGGNLANTAPPPDQEKSDAKGSPASLRAYLPTIRLKALLDNERQSVADLQQWLRKYAVWLEGGAVNLMQKGQIEEEYQRSRLRALRLDADYHDSLDEFTSRFRISEEGRKQMENAALSPMTMQLRHFEEFSRDTEAAINKPYEMASAEDVAKIRPALVKILTESALVKNTTFPKRFLKLWDEWKKIEDRRKLMDRITKIREDLFQLRLREAELAGKPQELPEADRKRMETLKFELDVGEFQLGLLIYEKQSWKNIENDAQRLKQMRERFFGLTRIFQTLLEHAYTEQFNRLVQSWPALAPVKIKDVDLLACKPDKAEETVTSLLKTPDAQREGRKKIRRLRTLAESYPIQQRLFRLASSLRENRSKWASSPPSDNAPDIPKLEFAGPLSTPPPRPGPDLATELLLKAEASFARAKRQLLQTWIDYQMVRLDVYNDLGLSPP